MAQRSETIVGADAITEDVIEYVISFLTPDDLLAAMQVNAYWHAIGHRDSIWRAYIVARWRIERPERLKRTFGTTDCFELYRYLDRNRFVPRGKFTTQQTLVWGKSRQEGADVWLTVAHRPDCRVLSTGATTPYIQLRVVVQNIRDQALTLDLCDMRVRMKNGSMGKVLGVDDSTGSTMLAPTLLALNGRDVLGPTTTTTSSETRSRMVRLEMFEFAVVRVNVACRNCEFEAEFLEGCSALWLPIRRVASLWCTDLTACRCGLIPDSVHCGNIRVPIVDEAVIWRHYTSISGRFMVLDCRTSWDDASGAAASPYLFKSPTRSVRKTSIS